MTAIHPFKQTSPDMATYSRLFLRDEELQLGLAAIFETVGTLKSYSEAVRIELGLSWAETKALLSIGAKSDSVLNLAVRLCVTKQALTKTLRRLEDMGLIKRIDDKIDKRRKILSLTSDGHIIERKATETMRNALARAYKKAGAEAVIGFDQVLWSILGMGSK